MRLITRDDIERWAPTFYAKGDFPALINDLTRATTPRSTFMQFPFGSAIFINILENLNSDAVLDNYSSALFNKRGYSSREPFDGGSIEREHATHFNGLSGKVKFKFPKVAALFKRLALGYEFEAKQQDERSERDKLEY
jgi:hypothetical protein